MKKYLSIIIIIICGGAFIVLYCQFFRLAKTKEPIKIGLISSFTGPMGEAEKNQARANLLAVEEINATGGILGRKVLPIIVDNESSNELFVQKAKELIEKEKVVMIVGGWMSGIKRMIKPLI